MALKEQLPAQTIGRRLEVVSSYEKVCLALLNAGINLRQAKRSLHGNSVLQPVRICALPVLLP